MGAGIHGLIKAINKSMDYLRVIGIDKEFINQMEGTLITVNSLASYAAAIGSIYTHYTSRCEQRRL